MTLCRLDETLKAVLPGVYEGRKSGMFRSVYI